MSQIFFEVIQAKLFILMKNTLDIFEAVQDRNG